MMPLGRLGCLSLALPFAMFVDQQWLWKENRALHDVYSRPG